jgi:hypothetical protein
MRHAKHLYVRNWEREGEAKRSHGTQAALPEQQLKNIPAWRGRERQIGHGTQAALPEQQLKDSPAWRGTVERGK